MTKEWFNDEGLKGSQDIYFIFIVTKCVSQFADATLGVSRSKLSYFSSIQNVCQDKFTMARKGLFPSFGCPP